MSADSAEKKRMNGLKYPIGFDWLKAARYHEQSLEVESEDDAKAEIWRQIGFSCELASRQTEDQERFKDLRKQSVEAYKQAAKIIEHKDPGAHSYYLAKSEYVNSWLASTPSEIRESLKECCKHATSALNFYEKNDDNLNYCKTFNVLLRCHFDLLRIAPNAQAKRRHAEKGIEYGKKAISIISSLGYQNELVETYSLASLQNWYAANIFEENRHEVILNSLNYSEKALQISNEIDNPYNFALSRWAASKSTLFFKGDTESSFKYANEMLRQGTILRDNYLKGIASYLLAYATDWRVLKEVNTEKKREGYKKIIRYTEDAIKHLILVSHDYSIAASYLYYTESHSFLSREVEVNREKKRSLLKKAVKIGRKGLEYAYKSGSPDTVFAVQHALSKALHFNSNLESRNEEKTEMLEEALNYRIEYLKIVEDVFPHNYWVLGVGKNYAALIEAELSRLEEDKDKKTSILESSISYIEDAISDCTRWISNQDIQSRIVIVADYENIFGRLLDEQFQLTSDKDILNKAITVYNNTVDKFKRVNLPSRAAESYWKIALIHDTLNEFQRATRNFEYAFAEYKVASRRIPEFEDFYLDYALYMKAWSEIQTAKSAHLDKDYNLAKKLYERTANILKESKTWNYYSPNFQAWSLLEGAEDLSRKEDSVQSIETFRKAYDLFHEAKTAILDKFDQIDVSDERDLAKRIIEVSDSRAKYCTGRISIEEAKILDRQGRHIDSSKRYGAAAEIFQEIMKVEEVHAILDVEKTRRELTPLIYLCQAWERMMMAEVRVSPILYEEAADLFKLAYENTLDQTSSYLALAHSNFCRALEAGTEFEITRDEIMYTTSKKYMSAASNYYLKAGHSHASEYAKANQRLFDAYFYIDNAKNETNPSKEARYYIMAEKVLQISASSFMKADHPEKVEQIEQLITNVKEEKELALSLSEVLLGSRITSSTESFSTLTPTEESAVGLDRFEQANIQAKLVQPEEDIKVGEDFILQLQIANLGKIPVSLTTIANIIPQDFEIVSIPETCTLENEILQVKGIRLEPLKTEYIKLSFKSFKTGEYKIEPSLISVDETGNQILSRMEPLQIIVSELILPGRITTGHHELDRLLLGGIPENNALILTSTASNERDSIIRNYIETGVNNGESTFYITVEVGGVEDLTEENQTNFYIFICNRRASTMVKDLPNVYKLTGVENLTNINIALTRAFRRIDTSLDKPKRACIEIVSDVLLIHHALTTRRWLSSLLPDLKSKGFTTLAVMNPLMHPPEEVHAILDVFDGEINIFEKDFEKYLIVKKLSYQKYLEHALPFKK